MNREQIIEELKLLKSYEVAVREYEANRFLQEEDKYSAAPCRVTLYSDMPMARGSGSRPPKLTGVWMMADYLEYERCLYMSRWLRAALDALTVQERTLMEYKYLDGYSLKQAGEKMYFHEQKAKNLHGAALKKMEVSLKFVDSKPILQPA